MQLHPDMTDAVIGPMSWRMWTLTEFLSVDGATYPSSLAKRLVMSTSHRAHAHIPTLRREDLVFREDEKHLTEDWEECVPALFEWVGMAGLGSQRCGGRFISQFTLV